MSNKSWLERAHWESFKTIEDVTKIYIPSNIRDLEDRFLYGIVKKYKPNIVVETGSGKSSIAILVALRENGGGQLHSIDLPYIDGSRSLEGSREAIYKFWKDALKEYPNWDIREKDICEELPILLDELPSVDLFFHDSHHTKEQISLEWNFLMSSGKLTKGGLFGSHDRRHGEYKNFMQRLRNNPKFESVGFCKALEIWKTI